jgi:hypothetical protein
MSVGTQLREARNARTLKIAEVSQATKIQPWVIEAIEADRLQELMSPVYVKGFLTTYAKFLRVAPEPLLAQFAWKPPEEEAAAATPALPPIAIRIPWARLRRAGALALGCGLVATVIIINPLRWLPKISMPTFRTPKLASITPVPRQPAKPQPTKPAPAKTVPSDATVKAAQPLTLEVTAHRSTWIRVRADGKLLAQQRLQRGAHEQWTAKKRLELVVAHPAQVTLTLNGQSISPQAITHQGRLVITHQGIAPLSDGDL